nr:serine/threonine-protein phosphatase [Treponema sp.]
MTYVILNILIGVVCIALSIYVDSKTGNRNDNPLIGLLFILAVCSGITAFLLLIYPVAPSRFMLFLGRVDLVTRALYAVLICSYCIRFPRKEFSIADQIFVAFFMILAVYISFTKITRFNISRYIGIEYLSAPIFSGAFEAAFSINWYDLFRYIYVIFLPGTSALMMLVRSENTQNRIERQKMYINSFGIAIGWFFAFLIYTGSLHVPLYSTLYCLAYFLMLLVFIQAAIRNVIYDLKILTESFIRFSLRYIITGVLAGLLFAFVFPLSKSYGILFYLIVISGSTLLLAISHQILKIFGRRSQFRSSKYTKDFEDEIAALDYNTEPEQIMNNLFDIFKRNLRTSSLSIMIDNGNGELAMSYSTEAIVGEEFSISTNNTMLDSLWNMNQQVIFKTNVESQYIYESIRPDLLSFFEKTKSDAFIVLNEGRRIIGILLLGQKKDENIYTHEDFNLFTKLYSYSFVVAFYMKNIVNEAIVGTVNREIRMSGQIITSIQENMDAVKNPKVDLGYTMVPAHNIGGEFVDLIRLSDTRHIFIIGSLSGKGISASMSMVILKSIIRTYLSDTPDFKLLVQKVNEFIRFNLPMGTFFAGVFALVDFSENIIYYINCGIPALFLYTQAYNNVIEIQGDGRVLGFVKDVSNLIKVKKVKLNRGDIILACTDGLINSTSLRGEVYGKDRVQHTLMENMFYPAKKIAQFSYDSLVKFASKELEDDVTV